MYCEKCGEKIKEGATFCHKCGVKLVYEYVKQQGIETIKEETFTSESDPPIRQDSEEADSITESESLLEKKVSEFKKWWNKCSKEKRILVVLGALLVGGVALYALIAFLREFGYLLFGIAVMGGFILTLKTGTKEEKIETRKTIVQMVVGGAIIAFISIIIVLKPDFLSNIIQPGANVRNAYLSQYSESVTIEDAFESFFENGKWSTYKEEDYSYVVFNGVCEYLGERVDAKVTFKITGENFCVDSLDINGQTQNNIILYSLLTAIYEDYQEEG